MTRFHPRRNELRHEAAPAEAVQRADASRAGKTAAPAGLPETAFTPVFLACLVLFGLVIMALTPPLQSPDEAAHLSQAYAISNLSAALGKGGEVDPALLTYSDALKMGSGDGTNARLTPEMISTLDGLKWSGEERFSQLAGTGFYLPLLYVPQATGLAASRALGLSVDLSLRLARGVAFAACILVLLFAFRLAPPPPAVMALLAMPIAVFQLASASLDGMVFAITVLALSCFLRIARDGGRCRSSHLLLLASTIAVLGMTKINLAPMVLLCFAVFPLTGRRRTLAYGAAASAVILAWTAFVMSANRFFGEVTGAPTTEVVAYYLKDPFAFISVLGNTLGGPAMVWSYVIGFIGVLGWLDVPFTPVFYTMFGLLLLMCGALSLFHFRDGLRIQERIVLLVCAFASVILVFLALLVTWNVHPAKLIAGVQGRYFIPPALMVAFALGSGATHWRSVVWTTRALILAMLFFSAYATSGVLAQRYWLPLSAAAASQAQGTAPPAASPEGAVMGVSLPLQVGRVQPLTWPKDAASSQTPVVSVGIMFGTYIRRNPGRAELRLRTVDGQIRAYAFDLETLEDNRYRIIDVEPGSYSAAEIVTLSGGGPSVWQMQSASGTLLHSCLSYALQDEQHVVPAGCPPSP